MAATDSATVLFVGAQEIADPYVAPLRDHLPLETIAPTELAAHLKPHQLCVFLNEHYPEYRDAIRHAQSLGCPTLLLIDGIIEWRSCWENHYQPKVWKPILCHKASCIGRSQARVLSSWGNESKVEIVGLPRLDSLSGRTPHTRQTNEPFRLLVMTAKNPGFTSSQIDTTQRSLLALKEWLDRHGHIESTPLETVWRLTQDMAQRVGVKNALQDVTGQDLATTLENVDAVITTPSTTMLEGMLQGVPVALLDFHNTPQLTPAAWTISSPEHFESVIPELIDPPTEKLLYQKYLLHEHLECSTPATPRLAELIEKMQQQAQECMQKQQPLAFPAQMLQAEKHSGANVVEAQLQLVAREQQRELEALRQENIELRGRLSRFEEHPLVGTLARWRRRSKGLKS
jgi:hypothetical protein